MTFTQEPVFIAATLCISVFFASWLTRFSWGKTIARAPLGNLAGGRSLSGSPKIGSRTGGEGNTNLQPFESKNLDLSLEYYYAEGSYASVGYFNKDVKNFISPLFTDTYALVTSRYLSTSPYSKGHQS